MVLLGEKNESFEIRVSVGAQRLLGSRSDWGVEPFLGLKDQGVQCWTTACGQVDTDIGSMGALQVGQMLIALRIFVEAMGVKRQLRAGVEKIHAIFFINDVSF